MGSRLPETLKMNKNGKNPIYGIIFTGVMAAMVFVTTYFLRIEVPTPTGPTMIKVGNIVCLLSGLLFGGLYGGLAAGFGSMLFDLLDPKYAASAPFTLVFFFVMGFVCGVISHLKGRKGLSLGYNVLAAVLGSLSYFVLHIGKSIIVLVLAGSELVPAVVATAPKMITSGINAGIAVVCSVLLAVPLNLALRKAGMFDKLYGGSAQGSTPPESRG